MQLQGGEQGGEESADQAVAGEQVVEVGVDRGAGGGIDGLDGGGELFAGQVQCVVTGGGFQVPGHGEQGRGAALLAHPGDGLGFGGGCVAGERLEPTG